MGVLRLFLAFSVIAAHSGTTVFGLEMTGPFAAVQLFFVISGFYMSLVLNEKYNETQNADFIKNRFLKIYPVYLVGIVFGLIVSWGILTKTYSMLTEKAQLFMIFENIFLFGQDASNVICIQLIDGKCALPVTVSANPPSWSLAVEILFYCFAPLLLRSIWKTILFLAIGILYQFGLLFIIFPNDSLPFFKLNEATQFNYNLFPASFMYFALGALIYMLYKKSNTWLYFGIVSLAIPFSFIDFYLPWWQLLLFCAAVPALFSLTKRNKFDRSLGELSFPIYVLHWPILQILQPVRDNSPDSLGVFSLGTWVSVISFIAAIFVYRYVEVPVSKRFKVSPVPSKLKSSSVTGSKPTFQLIWKVGFIAYLLSPLLILYVLSK